MNDKPTRQELEKQIAILKKQNRALLKSASEKAELNLIENEKYIYSMLNSMGDSVFVKDDKSRLLLVNDSFCAMFGLPRAEIIGKTLAEYVPLDERESFLKIDRQVILDGIENINEETLTLEEGKSSVIYTRKTRFIDADGNRFLIGVIRDVTDRKKAEQDLKESEKQFRELNTTKDKLFSIIGHDLRSPFNNILGLSELLDDAIKGGQVSEAEQFLAMIISMSRNTLVLLENLLNWAKSQTGQISYLSEKISLNAILQEVLALSVVIAQAKNITIKLHDFEEKEMYSDEKILKTILRNLLSNAIKFTNRGGVINLFVTNRKDAIEISISDDGIGMSAETCKKLFTIDKNTSILGTANEKGSGLGLVLCKEFVDKLGGTIWVDSTLEKGSTFKFTIPIGAL